MVADLSALNMLETSLQDPVRTEAVPGTAQSALTWHRKLISLRFFVLLPIRFSEQCVSENRERTGASIA